MPVLPDHFTETPFNPVSDDGVTDLSRNGQPNAAIAQLVETRIEDQPIISHTPPVFKNALKILIACQTQFRRKTLADDRGLG